MASIDRYRPPREGYQPPTMNKTRSEQPPASPASRNEVPPAAPTPPQRSLRTSPPRPGASRGQSPRASRAQSEIPEPNQWSFTADEVVSTPSVIDGLSLQEERLRRAKGVNFIYQAGVMLDLPQITLWVAGVFFHRFYMRYSMVPEKGGIHHYNIAATALFLGNKVEENCRKTKDIIIAVAKVAQKNSKLIIDEQSKEYWLWRDSILMYEEIMLEQLTFDLMVDNPYRNLFELLGQLDIVHNKSLRQAAWTFCNDACLTSIPLLFEPRDVAISAIFFGSVHTNQQIDDIRGEPWWRYLDGDEGRCTKAIDVMRQFYTENPLRKQNPSLPSPPYFLENTRRRTDALLSQPDTMSSNSATPLDRLSRSPGVMSTNGDRQLEPRSHAEPPLSPTKRKDTVDSPVDGARAEKRARMSEDEGEIEG